MDTMLIVRFAYSCAQEELSALAMDFATNVKPHIDGLIWKVYLNDPDQRRSAGLYLFRDRRSANSYLNGPYLKGLGEAPMVSDVSVEVFRTMHEPSIQSGARLLESQTD